MNIAAIKERLALLFEGGLSSTGKTVVGVTGVKRAYAQGPLALPETDLPLVVIFTGPTRSVTNIGGDLYQESRQFNCRLYVVPVGQGIDGEAERKVEPFIERGERLIMSRESLGDGDVADFIAGVFVVVYMGDSGVQVMRYAGIDFLGVEFRVAIDAVIEQDAALID